MGELLVLDSTKFHPAAVPAIEQRAGRYIGYFGEQLVFVHDRGEPDATLCLGDLDWEPRRVSEASRLPVVGDLILNREERAFVCACWIATAWRRRVQLGRSAA